MKRLSLLLALPLLLAACSTQSSEVMNEPNAAPPAPPPPPTATTFDNNNRTTNDEARVTINDQSIAALAMNTPQLSMLVDALVKADLAEAMKGDGPFTVFAPINDAIDDADLDKKSGDALKNILLYHVVEGEYEIEDFDQGMMLKTMAGQELGMNRSATDGEKVTVQQIEIITSVEASNGVIHFIGAVLDPTGGN